jgi:hypothetical protein
MNRLARLAALAIASVAASTSFAAQVSITGAATKTIGTADVAALNSDFKQTISSTFSGGGFTADVRIVNCLANGQQCFTVQVESMRFDKYTSGSKTITLEIIQDFAVVAASTGQGTATQTFNATANVPRSGQTASFSSDAYHEGTQLPRFTGQNASSGGGWTPIDCGTTNPVTVYQSGTYRIRALYTFTLNSSNGNWMALEILPGQHDNVSTTGCLVLVPLPPAAWAGLSGLAMLIGYRTIRRRQLQAAM